MTALGFIVLFMSFFAAFSMVYVLGNFLFKGDLKQWLSDRSDRTEARKAAEHKRKTEQSEKVFKSIGSAIAIIAAIDRTASRMERESKSRPPQFPPGGIVHPKPAGPEGIGVERGEFFVPRNQPKT